MFEGPLGSRPGRGLHHTRYVDIDIYIQDSPGGPEGKESSCSAGDSGSIPGSGRSPGGGHGKPTPVFLPGQTEEPGGLQSMLLQRVGPN